MGKAIKAQQRKRAEAERHFLASFVERSRAAKAAPPEKSLIEEFLAYSPSFVRPPEGFVPKTRSSSRARRARELARYLFGRYRVPRVLDGVWDGYVEAPEHSSLLRGSARRNEETRMFRPPLNPVAQLVEQSGSGVICCSHGERAPA